jgi:magnesium transporter
MNNWTGSWSKASRPALNQSPFSLSSADGLGVIWGLVALTVGTALAAIVTFGSLVGAMLPFTLKALNFDPATASAPLVATLADVSGIVIYFSIALFLLTGTLL